MALNERQAWYERIEADQWKPDWLKEQAKELVEIYDNALEVALGNLELAWRRGVAEGRKEGKPS